jgi:hypothetical protein
MMSKQQASVVFDDLTFHCGLDETATYSYDGGLSLVVNANHLGEETVVIRFTHVVAFRCHDSILADEEGCVPDAPRYDTLLRVLNSEWLSRTQAAWQRVSHNVPKETSHFIVFGEDRVWEILASGASYELANNAS